MDSLYTLSKCPGKMHNPIIKRRYPRWYLEKLVSLTEIEFFQDGPRSSDEFCNLALEIPY